MPVAASPGSDGPTPGETPDPEVVGGAQVEKGSWRDAAGVYFQGSNSPGCTAVLIAPTVALTARHCIGGIDQLLLDATRWDQPDGVFAQVISEIPHPELDIAALILANNPGIEPRVIASGCVLQRDLKDGANVAIVGYGAIDTLGEQFSYELREAFSTVVDHDCSDRPGCYSPGKEIGAGGDGIDACFGDSGGPLYLMTEHYDYLVGITSRAFSGVDEPCRHGGVYVRPDAILDWLDQVTPVTIPRADCNTPPDPSSSVLHAESGQIGKVTISPNDPDEGNSHKLKVVSAAMFGEAGIDDETGVAFYRSHDPDFVGTDTFQVEVKDDGVPALSEIVTVNVVVEEGGGCACRSSGAGAGSLFWLVALGLVVLRRRRR